MQTKNQRKTYMVLVFENDSNMRFWGGGLNGQLEKVLGFHKRTGGKTNFKIFEIYDDLEIKNILHLCESPLKIKKSNFEFNLDVTVNSIEDENLPLLYQLSRSTTV